MGIVVQYGKPLASERASSSPGYSVICWCILAGIDGQDTWAPSPMHQNLLLGLPGV